MKGLSWARKLGFDWEDREKRFCSAGWQVGLSEQKLSHRPFFYSIRLFVECCAGLITAELIQSRGFNKSVCSREDLNLSQVWVRQSVQCKRIWPQTDRAPLRPGASAVHVVLVPVGHLKPGSSYFGARRGQEWDGCSPALRLLLLPLNSGSPCHLFQGWQTQASTRKERSQETKLEGGINSVDFPEVYDGLGPALSIKPPTVSPAMVTGSSSQYNLSLWQLQLLQWYGIPTSHFKERKDKELPF